LGRTVIRESASLDDIADTVTHYVAERIIEREWAIEGDWVAKRVQRGQTGKTGGGPEARPATIRESESRQEPLHLGWVAAAFALGILLGILGLLAYAWVTFPGAR
jgi:hypothetical protein